jgi:hypothetical protein
MDSEAHSARELAVGEQFLADFAAACTNEVQPAMEAVLEELRKSGGGGVIEHHAGGEARFQHPGLILWMSLEGDVVGEPRPDRLPYLKLEAIVDGKEIRLSEGDMWHGGGGNRSGRIGTWQISDLTRDRIIGELLDIARRAAH